MVHTNINNKQKKRVKMLYVVIKYINIINQKYVHIKEINKKIIIIIYKKCIINNESSNIISRFNMQVKLTTNFYTSSKGFKVLLHFRWPKKSKCSRIF